MNITLNQAIHQETDQLFWGTRFCKAANAIIQSKEWSKLSSASLLVGSAAASAYMLAFSYFCMEGVVRSYHELTERGDSLKGLRPFGDAGGWTMMSIFSVITAEKLYWNVVCIGESLRVKSICQEWQEKNIVDPAIQQLVQQQMNDISDIYTNKCFFQERLIFRHMINLNSSGQIKELDSEEELAEVIIKELPDENQFETTLKKIREKIDDKTGFKRYFHRCWAGITAANETGGYFQKVRAAVKGVALPLILTGMATLSYIGEYGLGLELYRDHKDLTATGHFGEWPLNVVEAMAVSYWLHRVCVVNEGDYVIIQKIYDKFLSTMQISSSEHVRLNQLANDELAQLAMTCDYIKLPKECYALKNVEVEGQL